MINNLEKILLGLIFIIIILSIETSIIMWIWNNIIINKFPNSNIQKLNFFESLAIILFTNILFKSYTNIQFN
jgi:hypothetical protein